MGYFTVSVPAGDYARLEEAMNTVPDSFFVDKIIVQIGRCDTAEKKTEVASTPSTRLETIAGDVDRTIRSSNAKEALKIWSEIYLYETNLNKSIYIPKIRIKNVILFPYWKNNAPILKGRSATSNSEETKIYKTVFTTCNTENKLPLEGLQAFF